MNGNKINVAVLSFYVLVFTLIDVSPVMAAEKEAGKTILARGSVTSKRNKGVVPLKRRSPIFVKDEIHIGSGGRAQFRMTDQALISLQENSILQIKNYHYQKNDKKNSVLMELLSGGLRTITGAVGKGNKKAYELRTPLATIGIRGTDYEVEIVSNGMFVAVWDGVIHLQARYKNGCNMLIGRSQPYRYIFVDQLGKCTGLSQVPEIFREGHSSNISIPQKSKTYLASLGGLQARKLVIEPLTQTVPGTPPAPPPPPVVTYDVDAFVIDQALASNQLNAKSSLNNSSTPVFKVGLNIYENASPGGAANFQQSVGGYPVSWGYWGNYISSPASKSINNTASSDLKGLIWSTYESTAPNIVGARTGTLSRYSHLSDSLLSSSAGLVKNLQVQMDVNFSSGAVTNGALSANTPNETWVAVFDGNITAGELDMHLNGASVINSDPATASQPRDANGFIAGDFLGNNAQAVIGAFGLVESNAATNHIEGVFIVEEEK